MNKIIAARRDMKWLYTILLTTQPADMTFPPAPIKDRALYQIPHIHKCS